MNEELGALLGGVTFLIFGAVLLGPALKHVSWQIALYAVLSLTLVRMLPVAIAMIGSRQVADGRVPRLVRPARPGLDRVRGDHRPAGAPGRRDTILLATYLTIGLSVFAHGITAAPLARRYARWYETHPPHRRPPMESVPAPHHRPRGSPAPQTPTERLRSQSLA